MPHKRHTRVYVTPKNSEIRRMHCHPSAPPKVVVEPGNGLDAAAPPPPVLAQPKADLKPVKALAAPGYNTSVRQKSEIDTITKMQPVISISAESMAAIAPKITQKMNFQPGDTIFKNLQPLNVNDSVVTPQKKSPRQVNKYKQPELKLADYLENIQLVEMGINEPEIKLSFERKPFNFLGTYREMYYDD